MLNWIVLYRTDYLHKMDLVLDNLQRLICHKTQPTNQPSEMYFSMSDDSNNKLNKMFLIRENRNITCLYFL